MAGLGIRRARDLTTQQLKTFLLSFLALDPGGNKFVLFFFL